MREGESEPLGHSIFLIFRQRIVLPVSALLSGFASRGVSFFREKKMVIGGVSRFTPGEGLKTAFFFLNENLAFSGMVGLSDDAFQFHPLHQRCSTIIADLQPALNIAG